MKSICQALIDEVHYSIPVGFVENVLIKRGFDESAPFTREVAVSKGYKGALADCLYSLIQAVNFSESDKSVGNLTDDQRRLVLKRVNALYDEIGEPLVDEGKPEVECLYL
jgi:hypothetical protein